MEAAREAYYQRDAPTLSDDEYDALFHELVALERRAPGARAGRIRRRRRWAGARAEMFEPVEHLVRLYSLDNAFTDAELTAWADRVGRVGGRSSRRCCAS